MKGIIIALAVIFFAVNPQMGMAHHTEAFWAAKIAQIEEALDRQVKGFLKKNPDSAIRFIKAAFKASSLLRQHGVNIPPSRLLSIAFVETHFCTNLGNTNSRLQENNRRMLTAMSVHWEGWRGRPIPTSSAGAVGCTQFLPTTFAELAGFKFSPGGAVTYHPSEDEVRKIAESNTPANPFSPLESLIAAGLYLHIGGFAESPSCAALRYVSGNRCTTYNSESSNPYPNLVSRYGETAVKYVHKTNYYNEFFSKTLNEAGRTPADGGVILTFNF